MKVNGQWRTILVWATLGLRQGLTRDGRRVGPTTEEVEVRTLVAGSLIPPVAVAATDNARFAA
jgi:hypothetical protein